VHLPENLLQVVGLRVRRSRTGGFFGGTFDMMQFLPQHLGQGNFVRFFGIGIFEHNFLRLPANSRQSIRGGFEFFVMKPSVAPCASAKVIFR
jgi:hypothetical protein